MSKVRVRIAPSPTGNLHVGTARAALFNELYARKHSGSLIVRIEDTDKERSKPKFEENILEGLKWLGLSWDEGPDVGGDFGPYRQSERRDSHMKAIQNLMDNGKAKHGEGETIVLAVEPQDVVFKDEIRGEVKVSTDSFGGDFIIARSPEDPLFHLAVVVDDAAMEISHVIRGEDHLHNTARHILLQQALGYETPIYAHLPLLLDEKRAKLSKRSGETSLLAYRDRGFLPQAMLNYLALLGWNPGDDREYFTHDELIEAFSFEKVQKGGAIFSREKLDSINRHYLEQLSDGERIEWGESHYQLKESKPPPRNLFLGALKVGGARASSYVFREDEGGDLEGALEFFFEPPKEYPGELLVWRKSDASTTADLLGQLSDRLGEVLDESFEEKYLEEELLNWIDQNDLGRGDTLWPMRVALTGREHSPGPFEVAGVIGKDETIRRLEDARAKINSLL